MEGVFLQKWEQLGLSDNFIFQKAMMNERLCTKILTEIIGVEVSKVEYKDYEKTISIRSDAKGIRLDAYIKGEDAVYSVEMQNLNIDNLKKRSRYYHDLIDLDLLEKGCRYKNLNNTYVIFICDFDLFGEAAGERNRSGSLFACPRLLRYRKESRTEAARRPGKESPCSNATTVLKIAPSSCCWPASRWPSSGCCAPSSMSSSGASSSPCSPLPSTMPCSAAAWAATWRR